MLIHREALELARNAAEPVEGVPFSLSLVRIAPNGAVTASDGRHWLRMQAAVDEPNLFDEFADPAAGSAVATEAVLVPAEVFDAFNAAMKKKPLKKGMPVPHVIVTQVGTGITLASSDGRTKRTFLLDAVEQVAYPDVDRTVPADASWHTVILDIDLLSVLLKTLKACKAGSVTMAFPPNPEGAIAVRADTPTGPMDGALMPMRKGDV